ncbi:MAG: redoxin domain-containing protein [Flavobacteriaceae bacterium]|nr:redoxin domain-containing protein [Flavobacteriaceae bacterium]
MKSLKIILLVLIITAFTPVNKENFNIGDAYKVGDIATDFLLKNIDEKMVSLADFKEAKGFIIIFTCNTCPVSVRNEDRILALDKKL